MKPKFLKLWTLPRYYMGAHWDGFYVFLSKTRDSDALTRANYDAGLAAVKAVASKDPIPGDPDDCATVQAVSENHFLCGWVEWIAIHESDNTALQEADRIAERLEDYPVVNEALWSQYKNDEANEVWKRCYSPMERIKYIRDHRSQFDFHSFQDLMQCVRGLYFYGCASELLN